MTASLKAIDGSADLPTLMTDLAARARDGKNAYIDVDSPFVKLPVELEGADWVQSATKESSYSAVDLMQLAITGGTVVSIAHDARVPVPAWLTSQFQPTDLTLTVDGQTMKVFQRHAKTDESLTFGSNAENAALPTANMYIVFVNTEPDKK